MCQNARARAQSYNVVFCITAEDLYGKRLASSAKLHALTWRSISINVCGCDSFENEELTTTLLSLKSEAKKFEQITRTPLSLVIWAPCLLTAHINIEILVPFNQASLPLRLNNSHHRFITEF